MNAQRIVPVWWLSMAPDTPSRGYWDGQIVEDLVSGLVFDHGLSFINHVGAGWLPVFYEGRGAVVVVPGRSHVGYEQQITEAIAPLPWVLLIVTGDEEHRFRWMDVTHPRMRRWVQTPDPRQDSGADGFLPVGWTPHTTNNDAYHLAHWPPGSRPPLTRDVLWTFAGQVTHPRRQQCADALRRIMDKLGRHDMIETAGFTQGHDPKRYAAMLASAKVAPCPSGPVTVDTFRVCEALQMGAVPVLDNRTPKADESDYWRLVFGDHPLPTIDDWSTVGGAILDASKPARQLQVAAWWSRWKAELGERFARTVRDLAGIPDEPDDLITVVVATSPTETGTNRHTVETIASVRRHLPRARVIIAADGVRPEQEHLRERYLRELFVWLWPGDRGVSLSALDEWGHQALSVKAAVRHVTTPTILFMEHDTPLTDGEIPWAAAAKVVLQGDLDVLRFHHEAQIHPEHRWLMVDLEPVDVGGVPVMHTMQWSQRPHLANTGFYKWMLGKYFGRESRTMIEDAMHGVVQVAWMEHPAEARSWWKLGIYAPAGTMVRHTHSDARGDAPKWDMIYEYDGPIPEGAPYPTSKRSE